MSVRNSKGEYVRDDEIVRFVLERHHEVLRALLETPLAIPEEEYAIINTLMDEAEKAIPQVDKQRGLREGEETNAITGGDQDPAQE